MDISQQQLLVYISDFHGVQYTKLYMERHIPDPLVYQGGF